VFTDTARLALTVAGVWLGSGKWLGRRLRDADPGLHQALTAALRIAVARTVEAGAYTMAGSGTGARAGTAALRAVASRVLDHAGGRVMEGYYRAAPADLHDRPSRSV
jgi:hypothetical protein